MRAEGIALTELNTLDFYAERDRKRRMASDHFSGFPGNSWHGQRQTSGKKIFMLANKI